MRDAYAGSASSCTIAIYVSPVRLLRRGGRRCRDGPPPAPFAESQPVAERFVRTIREGSRNHLILVGERALHRAVDEFVEHYGHERSHQGMGNRLLFSATTTNHGDGPVACRARWSGLLKYDHRRAAWNGRRRIYTQGFIGSVDDSRTNAKPPTPIDDLRTLSTSDRFRVDPLSTKDRLFAEVNAGFRELSGWPAGVDARPLCSPASR
jgi:hypothetical protein